MKKSKMVTIATVVGLLLTALMNNNVSAQTAQATRPIPDEILNIASKSCVKCHSTPGNKIALSHLNLSKWDTYTPEKQAAKAKDMCDMVSKGKMPPKKFKEQNPGFILTSDEIKLICDWSTSMQFNKK
jgi:hypothetical protein